MKTPFILIVAVVVIISLIVVSVLGSVPSIGGQAKKNIESSILSSGGVGIGDFAIGSEGLYFEIENNLQSTIKINGVLINDINCNLTSYPTIRSGQKADLICQNINSTPTVLYEYSFSINYSDISSNANYFLNNSNKISGVASNTSFVEVEEVPAPVCGNGILEEGEVCDSTLTNMCMCPMCMGDFYYLDGYVEDGATCSGESACLDDCSACINITTCSSCPVCPFI
jgi:hypothetical protein